MLKTMASACLFSEIRCKSTAFFRDRTGKSPESVFFSKKICSIQSFFVPLHRILTFTVDKLLIVLAF